MDLSKIVDTPQLYTDDDPEFRQTPLVSPIPPPDIAEFKSYFEEFQSEQFAKRHTQAPRKKQRGPDVPHQGPPIPPQYYPEPMVPPPYYDYPMGPGGYPPPPMVHQPMEPPYEQPPQQPQHHRGPRRNPGKHNNTPKPKEEQAPAFKLTPEAKKALEKYKKKT